VTLYVGHQINACHPLTGLKRTKQVLTPVLNVRIYILATFAIGNGIFTNKLPVNKKSLAECSTVITPIDTKRSVRLLQ
jgi:hypothetical protein